MDDNLFEEEVEAFLQSFLTPEDDPAEDFRDGSVMLLAAAQAGRTVIVRALLRCSKINVKGRDLSGDTALHHAVRHRFVDIAMLLLKRIGTGVNIANQDGETALTIATQARDESMVKLLLKSTKLNPNLEFRRQIDSKTVRQGPAFHIAVINKSDSLVDIFIQHAANLDLNYRDAQGRTPLHYAVLSGNPRTCEALLQEPSVQVNSVTEPEKQSVLSLAIVHDMPKLAHLLIARREVDINKQDHQGHGPLHHSAWWNQPAIMAHLLDRESLDVNAKDLCGRTALHIAASYGNATLVKQLVADSRTNVECKNNYGETPLSAARSANHKDVAAILERHYLHVMLGDFSI
jgi:ankyrin repeat protein